MRQHSPSYRARHRQSLRTFFALIAIIASAFAPANLSSQRQSSPNLIQHDLELSRPVRPWEFFDAVGRRAAIFGRENGTLESWIYPLKLFREFHLVFHYQGRAVP